MNRTRQQHVDDFIRSATTEHARAVADELRFLRECLADLDHSQRVLADERDALRARLDVTEANLDTAIESLKVCERERDAALLRARDDTDRKVR